MSLQISNRPTLRGTRHLLLSAGLPAEDLTEVHLEHFFYVGQESHPGALVGIELLGQHALLRSLVVSADQRGRGIGSLLVRHVEQHARECAVQQIFLLTTTARDFFTRHGYESVDRESAPPSIRATREFADICPASSAFMAKVLTA
jgi:amino-acid N-acetyltransferase